MSFLLSYLRRGNTVFEARNSSFLYSLSSIRYYSDINTLNSETENKFSYEYKDKKRLRYKRSQNNWSGFINLYKNPGVTSNDCVVRIKKILNRHDVGHGGTLDKLAEGILPIAIGSATKLLQYMPKEKVYISTWKIGIQTESLDMDTYFSIFNIEIKDRPIIREVDCSNIRREDIENLLPKYTGKIKQFVPLYSAVKQKGKRLSDQYRAGTTVIRKEREVLVDDIHILDFRPGKNPEVDMYIKCHSGVYVRSLCRDLCNELLYTKESTNTEESTYRPVNPIFQFNYLYTLRDNQDITTTHAGGVCTLIRRESSMGFDVKDSKCVTLDEIESSSNISPITESNQYIPWYIQSISSIFSLYPCLFIEDPNVYIYESLKIRLPSNTIHFIKNPNHLEHNSHYKSILEDGQYISVYKRSPSDTAQFMGIGKYIKNDKEYMKEYILLEESKKKLESTKQQNSNSNKENELSITEYLNQDESSSEEFNEKEKQSQIDSTDEKVDLDLTSISNPVDLSKLSEKIELDSTKEKPRWTSSQYSIFLSYPETEGIVELLKKVNVGREVNTSSSILSSKQLDHMNIFSSYNARVNIKEQVKNYKKKNK